MFSKALMNIFIYQEFGGLTQMMLYVNIPFCSKSSRWFLIFLSKYFAYLHNARSSYNTVYILLLLLCSCQSCDGPYTKGNKSLRLKRTKKVVIFYWESSNSKLILRLFLMEILIKDCSVWLIIWCMHYDIQSLLSNIALHLKHIEEVSGIIWMKKINIFRISDFFFFYRC